MTEITKPSEVKRDWVVIDATDKRFGRMLTEVAVLLRGKHKPSYILLRLAAGQENCQHCSRCEQGEELACKSA